MFNLFRKNKTKNNLDNNFISINQEKTNDINFHLIFHIHCIDHEKVHYAIEKLKNSLSIFNGHKIITVSSSNNIFHNNIIFQKVVNIFKNKNVHIIPVDNSLKYKESQHFFYRSAPLLKHLTQNDPDRNYVFFGHSKGSSHEEKNYAITCWVNTLWKYNIDLFDDIVKLKICKNKNIQMLGCLKTHNNCSFGSKFHYSGTFFWFDAKLLKDDKWFCPHDHVLSLEMWPGLIADPDQSISLFDCEEGDKYRTDFWYNLVFHKKVDKPHTVET